MQWIPKTNQNVIIRLLLVTGVGVSVLPWLLPTPSNNGNLLNDEVAWNLPTITQSNQPQQAYERLKRRQPWYELGYKPPAEVEATPSPEPEQPVKPRLWQFVGIIQQGQQLYMLVLEDKQTGMSKRYQVGEKLPDETAILAIAHDHVLVQKADTPEKIALYSIDKK